MIDLTPIINAIIGLLAMLVTYKLIPWIKANTTAKQQETLLATYRVLIFAAEQLYGAGHGPEKLDYVVAALKERGVEVDIDAIEAVFRENMLQLHTGKPAGQNNMENGSLIEGNQIAAATSDE